MPCHELPDFDRHDDGLMTDSDIAETLTSLVKDDLLRELPGGRYELTEAGTKLARRRSLYQRFRDFNSVSPPDRDQWNEAIRRLQEHYPVPACPCHQPTLTYSGWTDDGEYLVLSNDLHLMAILEKDGDELRMV